MAYIIVFTNYTMLLIRTNVFIETKQITNKRSKTATNDLDFLVNKTPTESYTRKLRSSSPAKTVSNADLAIQRWKKKLQSQSKFNPTLYLLNLV